MRGSRITTAFCTALATIALAAGPAHADEPVGPARPAPCPGLSGDPFLHSGKWVPYRCHSAVRDPAGNVVILRTGRTGTSGFGYLHGLLDHNVDDHVIERVVSSAFPLTAGRTKVRYIAELRVQGRGVMSVWVEVATNPSRDAADDEPFGVLTAYCKLPSKADPENRCPDWVNDSLL